MSDPIESAITSEHSRQERALAGGRTFEAFVDALEQMIGPLRTASGTSGSAQDRNGLDPKGAGPAREAGDAQ